MSLSLNTPRCAAALLCIAMTVPPAVLAQAAPHPDASQDQQRAAMARLSFLTGQWSGPIAITRGPGEPLHMTQTEHVQMKLDGLLLLIEGSSRDAAGKVLFQALATVAFDTATNTYRFRAYNEGRYLDAELTVPKDGFSWGFEAGPAHVTNSMHLTATGAWDETTEVSMTGAPARQAMQMVLQKQP